MRVGFFSEKTLDFLSSKEEDKCCICYAKWSHTRSKEVVVTPCKHLYHYDCLSKYLSTYSVGPNVGCCVTCRSSLIDVEPKYSKKPIKVKHVEREEDKKTRKRTEMEIERQQTEDKTRRVEGERMRRRTMKEEKEQLEREMTVIKRKENVERKIQEIRREEEEEENKLRHDFIRTQNNHSTTPQNTTPRPRNLSPNSIREHRARLFTPQCTNESEHTNQDEPEPKPTGQNQEEGDNPSSESDDLIDETEVKNV